MNESYFEKHAGHVPNSGSGNKAYFKCCILCLLCAIGLLSDSWCVLAVSIQNKFCEMYASKIEKHNFSSFQAH
jgi:hypothetical protein